MISESAVGASHIRQSRLDRLAPVLDVVERAKRAFARRLARVASEGGVTLDRYHRYLTMQYHLTRQVQRHFLHCASSHALMTRKRLREFLVRFANEEEPHYLIAEQDLAALGLRPLHVPLDVALWHSYFLPRVAAHPFHRLGATCVLENLGSGAGATGRALMAAAPFLNERNTRFLDIHFHEVLPHGDQVIEALLAEELSAPELLETRQGAVLGAVLYLRMVEWVFGSDQIANEFEEAALTVPSPAWDQ